MASNVTTQPLAMEEKRHVAKSIFGGSLAESIAAGATIVLSLIALSGTMVEVLLPIAVITMGAAFLLEGGGISMRFTRLLAETGEEDMEKADVGTGVTAEFLGGIAGMVLGILSVLRLYSMILLPVAVIAYGATLVLSSRMMVRMTALELEESSRDARFRKIMHEITTAAAGVEFLFGLSVAVLGIIALTGTYGMTLSSIALLVAGISCFVTGASVTVRMSGFLRHKSV